MPQAKPIINDETVAALTGASAWPNVTLTGSVDCRKKPPMHSVTVNAQPDRSGAETRNGVAITSEAAITLRGPSRSAAGPPKNPPTPVANRYAAAVAPASLTLSPRRVSIVGTNVANASDVNVRSTTMA